MIKSFKKAAPGKLAAWLGIAILPLAGAVFLTTALSVDEGIVVRSAAAEHGGGGHGAGSGNGGGNGEGKGAGGEGRGGTGGGSAESDVFRDEGRGGGSPATSGEDEEDSDRPEWAGTPGKEGKPGGGSSGTDRMKGGDYGDLFVILRDDEGKAILDANGNVQPCLDAACNEYIQLNEDGEVPSEYADQVIEAEFGRLNVTRAPSKVLDHSLTELLAKLDGAEITLANLDDMTDESGRLIDLLGNTIDSPLENLALYKALLEATASAPVDGFYTISITADHEGEVIDVDIKVAQDVVIPLAASALAAGSDKYGELSIEDVAYISGFLGVDDELGTLVSSYTYDRTTYFNDQVWVLESVVIDGTTYYQPALVNVLDMVTFNSVPSIDNDNDGFDIFVQHADDAVQVLEYVHDNAIEPPVVP